MQDPAGRVLDKWSIATREEEQLIIQQFLRFGETKSIAQEIILQDARENREKQSSTSPRTESEIKRFIERSNIGMQSFMRGYDARHLMARPGMTYPTSTSGTRLLSPSSVSSFSPSGTSREGSMVLPVSTATPMAGSPLTRLQGMQPFDYRKEHISPTVSPSVSDKSLGGLPRENPSPQNLSMSVSRSLPTPPSQLSLPASSRSEISDDKMTPTSTATSDSGDLRDDASDVAINYSTKDTGNSGSSSVFAENKLKHLRKSANPMKRPWQPTPGYGGTLISPSGKKRVLCTACNKTFCDKGALKIHYSAVHLKEMHKCTVEGCNMMFSSRRSRNRHSANPNPKLHMPQTRRKLPEGALVVDDKCPLGSALGMMPPGDMHREASATIATRSSSGQVEKGVIPKQEPDSSMLRGPVIPEPLYFLDPRVHPSQMADSMVHVSKLPKLEQQSDPPSTPPPAHSNNSNKRDGGSSRRKRKSLAPTRCAQTEEVFVMSDENSNDGMSVPEENMSDYEGIVLEAPSMSDSPTTPKDCYDSDTSSKNGVDPHQSKTSHLNNNDFKSASPPPKDSFHEIKENAIRQMDNISQLQLKDMCVDGCDDSRDMGKVVVVEPKPVLERGDKRHDSSENEEDMISDNGYPEGDELDDYSHDDMEDGMDSPSTANGDSPTNGMDVPIDKDNPRKCPACGKMFQNHFGVKTHYQNVHLKLMHTCTVEGCNAAFPSKRSRDRHSGNLNLHRKLLSTSSSDNEKVGTRSLMSQSLRDEFLPRIYESQQFQANSFGPHATRLDSSQDINNLSISSSGMVSTADSQAKVTSTTPTETNGNGNGRSDGEASPEHPLYNNHHGGDEDRDDLDLPQPDPDGTVSCHICNKPFRDNLILKEHFEKVHPKEMYRCTIRGCEKIFSTRKSRNRHSQNDNLHRHLSHAKPNGVTA